MVSVLGDGLHLQKQWLESGDSSLNLFKQALKMMPGSGLPKKQTPNAALILHKLFLCQVLELKHSAHARVRRL